MQHSEVDGGRYKEGNMLGFEYDYGSCYFYFCYLKVPDSLSVEEMNEFSRRFPETSRLIEDVISKFAEMTPVDFTTQCMMHLYFFYCERCYRFVFLRRDDEVSVIFALHLYCYFI